MIKRVLIIDDDEAIRKVFLLALEGSEFQTDTAKSGKIGLEMIAQVKYDFIFLDLKMPEMDGIETLRRIRVMSEKIPVYIITAFSGEYFDRLTAIREAGIDFELVRKPIGTGMIPQIVRAATGGAEIVEP